MRIFLASFFCLLLIFFTATKVEAACTVTTNPKPVSSGARTVNITIEGGLVPGREYYVVLERTPIHNPGDIDFSTQPAEPRPRSFTADRNTGIISVHSVDAAAQFDPPVSQIKSSFEAKNYTVKVLQTDNNVLCETSFPVLQAAAGTGVGPQACTLHFLNSTFTSSDNIHFKIQTQDPNFPTDYPKRKIVLKRGGSTGTDIKIERRDASELESVGYNLGKLEGGKYFLEVQEGKVSNSKTLCYARFEVCPTCTKADSGTGKPTSKGNFFNQCEQVALNEYVCQTAIGPINTNPRYLVTQVVRIILGLAGGIAILLIILSGYQMSIAAGNPEKIQEARDRLTSAIVGIVFIILSISILRIIGVEILAIPGF